MATVYLITGCGSLPSDPINPVGTNGRNYFFPAAILLNSVSLVKRPLDSMTQKMPPMCTVKSKMDRDFSVTGAQSMFGSALMETDYEQSQSQIELIHNAISEQDLAINLPNDSVNEPFLRFTL